MFFVMEVVIHCIVVLFDLLLSALLLFFMHWLLFLMCTRYQVKEGSELRIARLLTTSLTPLTSLVSRLDRNINC